MRSLIVLLCLVTSCAAAAQVQLYDRATGQTLPTYRHHGRTYVAGEPGHEYEIRIRSESPQRLLAVTTVDGVNVVTGETGAVDQAGYVLDAHGFARIEGWRKSMSRTAAFYFTKLPNSYAARTGRPDNVGVIGVALFRERTRCCRLDEALQRQESAASEPSSAARERRSADAAKAESKLGTGHGRSEYSAARYTDFERASNVPDETIVIYYDSHRNLQAAGITPKTKHYAHRVPQPFPGFVPDP